MENCLSFICDSMLGRLSRWLRVLGYDTLYQRDMTDIELLNLLLLSDSRILLTRDRQLYTRVVEKGFKAILIPYENIIRQLSYIGIKLNLNLKVNPNNSRCSICNSNLLKVSNVESVRSLIPPILRKSKRDFWYCYKCNKVFWKGRMWPNIVKMTATALKNMRKIKM